ncbi:hypothetical protein ACFPTY_20070 [Halomonas beimenensis]|uniref:hypothetical protein n=1 Tax=Halomonas beimenensis TaxID=475662 RepID=UPI00360DE506
MRSPLVSQLALIEQLKRDPSNIEPAQLEQLGKLARRSYNLAEEFVQLARAEQLTETRCYECEFLAIAENARDQRQRTGPPRRKVSSSHCKAPRTSGYEAMRNCSSGLSST